MKHIVTVQEAVTAFAEWLEPTADELDAIDREMPLITARVDELDVQIFCMDRPLTELDARRLRRAHTRVLAVRRDLANTTARIGGAA